MDLCGPMRVESINGKKYVLNSVVKRWNRTLVEEARTMLTATKVLLDGENLDKMKKKGDAYIFVGYSTTSDPAPQCPSMALEHDSLSIASQSQVNVPQKDKTVITSFNELDILFSLMFDEYFNGATSVVSKSSIVPTANAFDKHQQPNTTTSTSTTVAVDTTQLDIQTTTEPTT
ncbi:hypothetical protein Tco_0796514 [Tanacetum coccineum]